MGIPEVFKARADLDRFFDSEDDGLLYVGHASILVRLSGKTILFDPVGYSKPYEGNWLFFPPQVMDPRLLGVDAVVVSHCHQDHFDIPFLRSFPETTPIYIAEGRSMFRAQFEAAGLAVHEVPLECRHEILPGIIAYAIAHETNGIDSSMAVSNGNFTAYHGNDNYADLSALRALRAAIGHIHVGCVPFAYIHWYPFLLDSMEETQKATEARRLIEAYLKVGMEQAGALEAEIAIPFGANLVYFDHADSVMNQAVMSPIDMVDFASATSGPEGHNFRALFAGAMILKAPGGDCRLEFEAMDRDELKARLTIFLGEAVDVSRDASPLYRLPDRVSDFTWLEQRLQSHGDSRQDHLVRLQPMSGPDLKIEIDLQSYSARQVDAWQTERPFHHFRIESATLARWLANDLTLEGVIGTRRFRLERFPERYNPEVLALINGAL